MTKTKEEIEALIPKDGMMGLREDPTVKQYVEAVEKVREIHEKRCKLIEEANKFSEKFDISEQVEMVNNTKDNKEEAKEKVKTLIRETFANKHLNAITELND